MVGVPRGSILRACIHRRGRRIKAANTDCKEENGMKYEWLDEYLLEKPGTEKDFKLEIGRAHV